MTRHPLQLRTFWTLLLAVVLCAAPSLAADQPDTPSRDELARQIQQTLDELQSERVKQRAAERRHREKLERIERQIDRLRQDLKQARQAVADQEQTVASLDSEHSETLGRATDAKARLDTLRAVAEPVIVAALERVEKGIPWHRPRRREALAAAGEQLSGDDPGAWARALVAVADFFGQELEVGRRVDLTNEPIELADGRERVHAWRVRVGLVADMFVAEDGSRVGRASAEAGDWAVGLDPRQARWVREAVAILREQAAPRLVPVPYSTGSGGAKAEGRP